MWAAVSVYLQALGVGGVETPPVNLARPPGKPWETDSLHQEKVLKQQHLLLCWTLQLPVCTPHGKSPAPVPVQTG